MIVQFWERDAFRIAIELFVLLVVSHLRNLRVTQRNPNLSAHCSGDLSGKQELRRRFLSPEALWSAAVFPPLFPEKLPASTIIENDVVRCANCTARN